MTASGKGSCERSTGGRNDKTGSVTTPGRRRFIKAGGAAAVAALAGCTGDGGGGDGGDGSDGSDGSGDGGDGTGDGGTTTGNGGSQSVTLTLLRPGAPEQVRAFLEPALEAFHSENSNIEVEPIYQGWTGWQTKVFNMLSQGNPPDVQLWPDYMQLMWLENGTMVPLGDRLDDDVTSQNTVFDKPAIDGNHYLLPASTGGVTFMYRKDVYEQAGLDPDAPPATMDDLYSHCQAISNNTDVAPFGAAASKFVTTVTQWSAFLGAYESGKILQSANGAPAFNTEGGITATNKWTGLKEYAQAEATSSGRGDLRGPFLQGDVAIHYDGPWLVPQLYDAGVIEDDTVGVARLPEGPAGNAAHAGYDGWAITNDENPDAAAKLINHLGSLEWQTEHDKQYGGVPVRQDEAEKEYFQKAPWPTLVEALQGGVHRPYHNQSLKVYNEALVPNLQSAWIGQKSGEQALADAAQTIENL